MRTLFEDNQWFVRYYPSSGPIQRLFFAGRLSERILKVSWEVLLLDCTYKTNHYRMPLCVISGVTGLNTSFYIGFAFLSSETYNDYLWVLSSLQQFYQEGNIPDPIFVGTDCEKALICALQDVMPSTKHAVCLWHVDKNVLTNCKPSFDIEESWQEFYKDWHGVLYSATEPIFEVKWAELQAKYEDDYWVAIDYLQNDLMATWKEKVIKCYTNKLCHFGNTTTSRAEGGHAKIKRQLNNTSTGMIIQSSF